MKLGKLPAKLDARTFRFASYRLPTLPKAPKTCTWYSKVKAPWGMMGNDDYGDCAFAALAHARHLMTAVASTEVKPDVRDVVSAYLAYTGGQDSGSVLLDVLNLIRHRTPSFGFNLAAYAAIDRKLQDFRDALHLMGSAYIGLSLPDRVVDVPDMLKVPWTGDRGAPNTSNGHCVELVGYTASNFYCVTWGVRKLISPGFLMTYCDEAYALVSADWMRKGRSPDGFNMAQLQADLGAL
jgi:hypothetical protein